MSIHTSKAELTTAEYVAIGRAATRLMKRFDRIAPVLPVNSLQMSDEELAEHGLTLLEVERRIRERGALLAESFDILFDEYDQIVHPPACGCSDHD